VKNIARWDGNNWFPMAEGLGQFVSALTVSGTNLFAGGSFTMAAGSVANRLARWDGNAWHAVGGNIASGGVLAIAARGNDLYIGGAFTITGITGTINLAKWNGSTWSTLGSGVAGTVNAIALRGNEVYVAGQFNTAGGNPARKIARWDGNSWAPLGSGMGQLDEIRGLAILNNKLHVTGDFRTAGGIPSDYFAIWHFPRPLVQIEWLAPGSFLLNWTSQSNKTYLVHGTTNLLQPFAPLSGLIPSGGTNTSYTNASAVPAQYFQIEEVLP
jgi:hypothetical protein